jgi:hypothetical protein
MNNISFGRGFISSKIKSHNAPVYKLNPSNGMPIVDSVRVIKSNDKAQNRKIKKN